MEGVSTVELTQKANGRLDHVTGSTCTDTGAFKRKHAAMQRAAAERSAPLDGQVADLVQLLHETNTSEKCRGSLVAALRHDAVHMHDNSAALTDTAAVFALNGVLGRQRVAELVAAGIAHVASVSGKIDIKLQSDPSKKQMKKKQ